MGVRRYSNIPSIRHRQELFDSLQWRCGADYYAPTIGELRDSGVVRSARYVCLDYGCSHQGASFELTRYGRFMNVRDLKRRQTCGRCYRKRIGLRLEFLE